jgi:hypothetical protein
MQQSACIVQLKAVALRGRDLQDDKLHAGPCPRRSAHRRQINSETEP